MRHLTAAITDWQVCPSIVQLGSIVALPSVRDLCLVLMSIVAPRELGPLLPNAVSYIAFQCLALHSFYRPYQKMFCLMNR